MDTADTATVDCPKPTCDGKVEIKLSRVMQVSPDGDTAVLADAVRQGQTCSCEYEEEEQDTLIADARRQLGDI